VVALAKSTGCPHPCPHRVQCLWVTEDEQAFR
jgi:hypothetical protein